MAIHLIAKEVALKALEAYERKGLSAQGLQPECAYRDGYGLPCAIGVALSPEEAARLEGCTAHLLITSGKISTDDPAALVELQGAHDAWAVPDEFDARDYESEFLKVARRIAGVQS